MLWDLINRDLFQGELRKKPEFRVWDADDCSGHFHVVFGKPVIEVHEVMFKVGDDHAVLETLVHEMVHQLQWERHMPICHDEFFKSKIKEIWDV